MIIGINGRIGSGKDTVGQIIQAVTTGENNWDLIQTHHQSNTVSDFIVFDQDKVKWEIKKFAAKLKQVASLLTGIPVEKFEDQDFKNTYLPSIWNTKAFVANLSGGRDEIEIKMTVREFLQKLGTDAVRNGLHSETWVNALFSDYTVREYPASVLCNDESVKGKGIAFPFWIITDMRFPNEYDAVKQRGGITVRVIRGAQQENEHISESALDGYDFDHIIYNDGTISDLVPKVQHLLTKFNLL